VCSISTGVEVPCPNALGISRVEGTVRSVVEVIVTHLKIWEKPTSDR